MAAPLGLRDLQVWILQNCKCWHRPFPLPEVNRDEVRYLKISVEQRDSRIDPFYRGVHDDKQVSLITIIMVPVMYQGTDCTGEDKVYYLCPGT